jgi:glycosyltransferase involved in cell wall biosynthesis
MKVLILNRRCIKHPEKGGAENYTYYIAKGLIEAGYSVEWFSSKTKELKSEEVIEGIKFIRKGNELTTHFYGFMYMLNKNQDWLIIDEFNGVGYFTFFKKNSILLIHQLYEEFWNAELGFIGYIPRFLEKIFLRLHKNKKTITVSSSTQLDLKNIGFKDIQIVYNGLEYQPLDEVSKKNENLTLLYLGRLKKTKNPESAIKIFLKVKEYTKDVNLYVAGTGPLLDYLKDKYSNDEGIKFLGYVSEEEKINLIKQSHFLIVPSIREGWGQVVIQANAFGTPAVGFRVRGLVDSIKDNETGFLVNSEDEAVKKIINIWNNKEEYNKLCQNALNWAKNFSWDKTKDEFLKAIEEYLG